MATAPKRSLSVLKRARQAEKRNLYNRAIRSRVKTLSKKVQESLESGDQQQVDEALRGAVKAISSAASKGVYHRNTASRKISRLSRLAHKTLTGGAV
jgi:small subunit ribosomal protein S20